MLSEIIYNYLKNKHFVNVKDLKKGYNFIISNVQIQIYLIILFEQMVVEFSLKLKKEKKRF